MVMRVALDLMISLLTVTKSSHLTVLQQQFNLMRLTIVLPDEVYVFVSATI